MNAACPWKTYFAVGGKTFKQIIPIMTLIILFLKPIEITKLIQNTGVITLCFCQGNKAKHKEKMRPDLASKE